MIDQKCGLCGLIHASMGFDVRGHTLALLGVFYESAEGWTVRSDILDAHPLKWVTVFDRAQRVTLSANMQTIREHGKPVPAFGGAILLNRQHWQPVPERIRERKKLYQEVKHVGNQVR